MKRMILWLCIVLLGCVSISFGQQDSTWTKWEWLIGDWVGEGSGAPGESTGWFSIHTELGGHVLMRKGHSEYPKSQNKPKSIHDDFMVVYSDPIGYQDSAIYFDNEGHVIRYSIAYPAESIVLTSEAANGVPVFRLTYTPAGPGSVNIRFEVSPDGKEFRTYTEGHCAKMK